VLPHGGPGGSGLSRFRLVGAGFRARGYAVFQPNFRGSGDYGAVFRNAGLGQWGRKMQTDISDGVADLPVRVSSIPSVLALPAPAMAAMPALAGVTVQPGLYRCAISVAGVADLNGMLVYDIAAMAGVRHDALLAGLHGATALGDDSLKTISPVLLAAHADAPILLIHGKDDTVSRSTRAKSWKAR